MLRMIYRFKHRHFRLPRQLVFKNCTAEINLEVGGFIIR